MKLPFFEHTIIALDVRTDGIHWVALNCLGNRISLENYGKVNRGDLFGLEHCLDDIKEQVQYEAFQIVCSFEDILLGVEVRDVPFFEDDHEVQEWNDSQEQELKTEYSSPVEIRSNVVEVDEDHRRSIYQVVDKVKLTEHIEVLKNHDLYPTLITTGISELGYSLIFEELFVSGQAAIITDHEQKFLSFYNNGLLTNVIDVGQDDISFAVAEADSYLRTEEASLEIPQHSIPLFVEENDKEVVSNDNLLRSVKGFTPLSSKIGVNILDDDYARACGVAIKSVYPTLDAFDFSPSSIKEQGREWEEKKECYRTGVLLFPTLIVLLLILYAVEGFLDVNLTETNQVLNQLSDKIELVNETTEQVNQATVSYQQVRSLVEKRRNSARLFELIGNKIPAEVWLQQMNITHQQNREYEILVYGIAPKEEAIAGFMGALENDEIIKVVELASSRKMDSEELPAINLVGLTKINEFQLRVEAAYQ